MSVQCIPKLVPPVGLLVDAQARLRIIDPEAETVAVLRAEPGKFRLAGRWRPGEKAHSRLLKGFTVEVGPLFRAS